MKYDNFLFGGAILFGIAVFAGIFFFAPSPFVFNIPFIQRAFLPASGERQMEAAEPQTATLVFAGDIMLARAVERTIIEKGVDWPFSQLGDLFAETDLVIGNLEGTVRAKPRYEVVNEMSFDTTPENLSILKDAGFTHVSLANNHADDFGSKVTTETRDFVTNAGLVPFGDPFVSGDFVTREIVNGYRISLVGFHAFGELTQEVAAAIASEKQMGQFVIVFPHWGPEYQLTPAVPQMEAAQIFAAAGADLIIGAHPHVVQTVEVIDGTPVVYSLGNFLFDQDFSAATMLGLTTRVTISEEMVDISFTPVRIVGRQTLPLVGEAAALKLTELGLPVDGLRLPRE